MHCWKVINVERDFGITRIIILSALTFVISFSIFYVAASFSSTSAFTDHHFIFFLIGLVILYPVHKLIHYFAIIDYYKNIRIKIKFRFKIYPILHLKIYKQVPKNRYLLSLIAPAIILNLFFIFFTIIYPEFTHYFSLLFGIHCAICLIDALNVNGIIRAPRHAFIEETPKGFEVLVPIDFNN